MRLVPSRLIPAVPASSSPNPTMRVAASAYGSSGSWRIGAGTTAAGASLASDRTAMSSVRAVASYIGLTKTPSARRRSPAPMSSPNTTSMPRGGTDSKQWAAVTTAREATSVPLQTSAGCPG